MLPLIILGSVALATLSVVFLVTRLSHRQSPPANRSELLDESGACNSLLHDYSCLVAQRLPIRPQGTGPCIGLRYGGEFRRSMQHEPRMEASWCNDVVRV